MVAMFEVAPLYRGARRGPHAGVRRVALNPKP